MRAQLLYLERLGDDSQLWLDALRLGEHARKLRVVQRRANQCRGCAHAPLGRVGRDVLRRGEQRSTTDTRARGAAAIVPLRSYGASAHSERLRRRYVGRHDAQGD